MSFEHDVDPAALYDELRRSFTELVTSLTTEQLATRVPATPDWTVQDAFAHVIGIASDLNHFRFADGRTADEWTAIQVETRRGRSVHDLADEWAVEAPTFVDGCRAFGYSFGAHFLGDLLQHSADVRQALGLTRPPDGDALLAATDFYIESFDESLRGAGAGSVVIRASGESFTAGEGPTFAELDAARYEVFRALGGRRSERQIRAMDWSGDVDRVVPIVSRYPLPERDLVE